MTSNNKKQKGSYYTPSKLADFVVGCLKKELAQKNISILEPSCGDGNFLKALKGKKNIKNLDIVELETNEILKAKKILPCNDFNEDFLDFFMKYKGKKNYDLIIGNPPYIKSKRLGESQIKKCEEVHSIANLSDKKIKNIWTSFLATSVLMLKPKGVLAFILPAEILQVNYAKEIRQFLKKHFSHIEIYTFKELFFGSGGQDTILLICKNTSPKLEVLFAHIDDISQSKSKPNCHHSCSNGNSGKWTESVLSEEEISLIDKYKKKTKQIKEYCSSTAGIVTGANQFFILNQDTINDYKLSKFVVPIIQKGYFVNNPIQFSEKDLLNLKNSNKPCYLLSISEKTKINKNLKKYLDIGEENEVNKGYKCTIRDNWYEIPSIWTSEAFFFKRSHILPKFTKNKRGEFYVTDSAYRVSMKDQYKRKINNLIFSFYNSFTLTIAELQGRFYGGGVLELTPNEFKDLHIPLLNKVTSREMNKLIHDMESLNTEEIINKNDEIILLKFLGMKKNELKIFQRMRKKLLQRRRVKI